MAILTVRLDDAAGEGRRLSAERVIESHGSGVRWEPPVDPSRSYGTVETGTPDLAAALRTGTVATVFDSGIIALAVYPSVPEALPTLEEALGGAGRPSGIVGCERSGDAVILEWDLDLTSAGTIMALIDLELARWRASRRTALLCGGPASWLTRIAAEGLRAPEIAADRVLEVQLERAGVVD